MDLTVQVWDAAGAPVAGADVTVILPSGTVSGKSDAQGNFTPGALPVTPFHVTCSHRAYLSEEVDVVPPAGDGSFVWDNPVCGVIAPANLVLRLGRLQASPTFPISNADLERLEPFNPNGVFTWIDNAGNRKARYLAMFNDSVPIVSVRHPLLPDSPGEGWERLRHGDPEPRDPSRDGDMVWLEWGLGEREPRMLVAAWIPRFRGPSPSELDFVVFFSPTTAPERGYPADKFPWRDPYPYMAVKRNPLRDKGSPALAQPYPGLGQRYLFELKWLVYQQLAARREATLIFPIQPSGDWGPFAYASGLARLIAEITHFMRRTARTDGLQSDREQDQAARPRYRVSRPGIHLPLPQRRQNILKPRRIILSGFSAGVGPIVGMLGTSSGQKMDDGRFENGHDRFGADVTPFLDAWMEVWDHDAPSEVRAMLEQAGPGWMNRNSRRMLRCYQSQFTSTPRNWIHTTPLAQFAPGSVKPPVSAAGVVADERHADDRCSLVYFDIGFLNHSASAHRVAPVFWKWTESDPNDPKKMIVRGVADEHQAVPMVTFGHAALLSGLKKTE